MSESKTPPFEPNEAVWSRLMAEAAEVIEALSVVAGGPSDTYGRLTEELRRASRRLKELAG